jgi:hypothetical protein
MRGELGTPGAVDDEVPWPLATARDGSRWPGPTSGRSTLPCLQATAQLAKPSALLELASLSSSVRIERALDEIKIRPHSAAAGGPRALDRALERALHEMKIIHAMTM